MSASKVVIKLFFLFVYLFLFSFIFSGKKIFVSLVLYLVNVMDCWILLFNGLVGH